MSNFEKQMSVWSEIFKRVTSTRKKRWEEFRTFHEWGVQNIPEEIKKHIGTIDNIHSSYGLEFTGKDYAWWGLLENPLSLDIIPVDDIKKKITDKLRKLLNDNSFDEITIDEAKALIAAFKNQE